MQFSARRRLLFALGLPLGGLFALATTEQVSTTAQAQATVQEDAEQAQDTTQILREGAKIESQTATCRSAGERLTVELSGGARILTVLENLASQRVLDAILEDPADNNWTISGTITEFQNRNFILLQRVTRATPSN